MKIKPIVLDHIKTKHTNYIIDFQLESNVTFITGDSGTGKSAVFSFLNEYSAEDGRLRCINYTNRNTRYSNAIRNSKGKLFVIDNADILLDERLKHDMAFDTQNQYIIIGRNPAGLLLSTDEIYELDSRTADGITYFSLKKAFA